MIYLNKIFPITKRQANSGFERILREYMTRGNRLPLYKKIL